MIVLNLDLETNLKLNLDQTCGLKVGKAQGCELRHIQFGSIAPAASSQRVKTACGENISKQRFKELPTTTTTFVTSVSAYPPDR